SAERIEELESFRDEVNEPRPVDVPWHFTELMRECVAQFTLRNIPRAERYIDLDMPMHYEVDDPVLPQVIEDIEDVRNAEVPRPEFVESWTTPLVNDFKIFLEEVLYLCPWDSMSNIRRAPAEDSLWS